MLEKNTQTWHGNEVRQSYIDFFIQKAGHTFVRSSSLVPGGDSTLLFTNAGMVQFKDIFLGKEKRPYKRAVNSQKCLRVAGKHNDLEDVGQDDKHHTFFEMLGNWSFGDYYQKEAINWAWELLTEVWKLPKEHLYATVFKDELGQIPTDNEAAEYWHQQPGFLHSNLFFMGRRDNFWEMAETGPCGPCSEIHYDLNPQGGPVTAETLDTERFIEIWNLVFIQYNRLNEDELEPLPERHIDTGMGFERIVSILQGVGSNYRSDLFWPLIQTTQGITEHNETEVEENFTSYRVIADHARASAFLIADGVVPGNLGRNYICRMIIRRAFRFAGKIGIHHPFLARVAQTVIQLYSEAYPELVQNRETILEMITKEEEQFQKTLEKATHHLENLFENLDKEGEVILSGDKAADIYTTYGMPLEITRDIAQERGYQVSEDGFEEAMQEHRKASGAGKAMGEMDAENVNFYRRVLKDLQESSFLQPDGISNNPYHNVNDLAFENKILAILKDNKLVDEAQPGEKIEIILPETFFYIESGGQVSDTGVIVGKEKPYGTKPPFQIDVTETRKPAAGIITHVGNVVHGTPSVGDDVIARVDRQRRLDIMRNHTATHLLHAALREILGGHARQAGSLVAPDRLRFDFTHPDTLSSKEIGEIESYVNEKILSNLPLQIAHKSLEKALEDGAVALFGEKYANEVRNITIGEAVPFSNELCGGTHVESTADIGTFLITSESSVAAGIRRIEAITGREAYKFIKQRLQILDKASSLLGAKPNEIVEIVENLSNELKSKNKELSDLQIKLAIQEFTQYVSKTEKVAGINLLTAKFQDLNVESLRILSDRFRQYYPQNGIAVLASIFQDRPIIIATVTEDLVKRGIKAGDLAGFVAKQLGGGGGGKATMAQAGGKDVSKIDQALESVAEWIREKLN